MYLTSQFQSLTSAVGKASSHASGAASGTSASKTFAAHGHEKHPEHPPVCLSLFLHISSLLQIESNFVGKFSGKRAF